MRDIPTISTPLSSISNPLQARGQGGFQGFVPRRLWVGQNPLARPRGSWPDLKHPLKANPGYGPALSIIITCAGCEFKGIPCVHESQI